MRRAVVLASVLAAVASSGCIEDGGGSPGADDEGFALSGAFTENATPEDVTAFQQRMRELGADDVAIMESFPMQFSARGFTQDECSGARAVASSLEYVASVSACRTLEPSENPDEPVSDEPT